MKDIGGAKNWHNFLNPRDWALGMWIYNQSQKPNAFGRVPRISDEYEYASVFGGTWAFKKSQFGINNDVYLYTPEDTYEIFCYCAQARSNPTGRQTQVGGPFTSPSLTTSIPGILHNSTIQLLDAGTTGMRFSVHAGLVISHIPHF